MNENDSAPGVGGLVCFDDWLRSINRSRVSGWNYRQRKWVETINIAGRIYISRAEIARFEQRAAAGEFARKVCVLKRATEDSPSPSSLRNAGQRLKARFSRLVS